MHDFSLCLHLHIISHVSLSSQGCLFTKIFYWIRSPLYSSMTLSLIIYEAYYSILWVKGHHVSILLSNSLGKKVFCASGHPSCKCVIVSNLKKKCITLRKMVLGALQSLYKDQIMRLKAKLQEQCPKTMPQNLSDQEILITAMILPVPFLQYCLLPAQIPLL